MHSHLIEKMHLIKQKVFYLYCNHIIVLENCPLLIKSEVFY